ncbi:esterase, PHB depolymerase family [Variovorax sp. RA8]|nr:esterase, PHB depolymerase family [Variovorax sp. RA8]
MLSANPYLSWFQIASDMHAAFFVRPAEGGSEVEPVAERMQRHDGYSLYVPASAPLRKAPMVVMLHGAGQEPDDFAAGTRMNLVAERRGFIVLYPAQSTQASAHRCWNWFDKGHQVRGQGEPARIADLTQRIAGDQQVDPLRIFVAGLSAGGAMAALLGELYPEVYAAVGVHSGLAARAGSDLQTALAAMRGAGTPGEGAETGMPTIVFHGDRDDTVHLVNSEHVIDASMGVGCAFVSSDECSADGRRATRRVYSRSDAVECGEHWTLHNAPHAWSGGSSAGSFAVPFGPDASDEMLRFFADRPRNKTRRPEVTPKRATQGT